MLTVPDVVALRSRTPPQSFDALEEAIYASGSIARWATPICLIEAIRTWDGFWDRTVPFLWAEMLAADGFPALPLLDVPGTIMLTQRQCVRILANAFFCTFVDRPSEDCRSGPELPSINFDELYGDADCISMQVAKLQMLMNYFDSCAMRVESGDPMSRPLSISRLHAHHSSAAHWVRSEANLAPAVVHPLGVSLDEARGMLRVDFANEIVGGAALAYGCVQEEIMFCASPELLVSRLYCPAMPSAAAMVVIGAEQFSLPKGYGYDLQYGGRFDDPSTLRPDGLLNSHVAAIDALDFRLGGSDLQYRQRLVLRELTKAWAGFNGSDLPYEVATGNWGCGAFGGDVELKSLIQWLAICRAGKVMHYFPWDNDVVWSRFPSLSSALVHRAVTVGELAGFLLNDLEPGGVYDQVADHFCL